MCKPLVICSSCYFGTPYTFIYIYIYIYGCRYFYIWLEIYIVWARHLANWTHRSIQRRVASLGWSVRPNCRSSVTSVGHSAVLSSVTLPCFQQMLCNKCWNSFLQFPAIAPAWGPRPWSRATPRLRGAEWLAPSYGNMCPARIERKLKHGFVDSSKKTLMAMFDGPG